MVFGLTRTEIESESITSEADALSIRPLIGFKEYIFNAFYPLILRLQFSHNATENKVYYDLATSL